MKTVLCIALVALATSVYGRPEPFLQGLFDLGNAIGKKTADLVTSSVNLGADAMKNAANIGLNTGKLAITGFGGVGKDTLDKAGIVGKEAIDYVNIIGDHMGGPLGDRVKQIGDLANKALETGINTGKKGIDLGEKIGTKGITVADQIVGTTADRLKEGAQTGNTMVKNTLDKVDEASKNFWG